MDLFRVQLNYIDTYQAPPTKFDPSLGNHVKLSQAHKESKIPIIRVFGSTETGQKVCAHIHGAFPYLYIEYTGDLAQEVVGPYIHRLHLSIDHALSVSYKRDLRDGNSRFVARVTVVKGIPFYGFHVGYRYYLKIYMLDPMVMTRLADLLRQGIVMKMVFQPFEAHLQYLLQWMVDYNLYGCDYIDCSRVAFRSPVPKYEELASPSHLWHDGSIPSSQISDQSELPRISHCSIEVDICVQDITNRHEVKARFLHHDFIEHLNPVAPDEKLLRSMASLWKNAARRPKSRIPDLEPDNSPSDNIGISMSAGPRNTQGGWIHEEEYRDKMMGLIMDEKSKSDGANISFSTFVQHNSLESAIRTSLEAVEDFFPRSLHTPLELSLDNTIGGTDYDTCYEDTFVDGRRVFSFNMNDHDRMNSESESNDDVLLERVAPGETGEYDEGGIPNLVDTTQGGNDIDCGFPIGGKHFGKTHSPSGTRHITGAANPSMPHLSVLRTVGEHSPHRIREPGYTRDRSSPLLSYCPSIQPEPQLIQDGSKRVEIPEVQTNTTPKRQKLCGQIYSQDQFIERRPMLDPESVFHQNVARVSLGEAAVAVNDCEDRCIATHKPTAGSTSVEVPIPTTKESSYLVAVTHDKSETHPLEPPTIEDCNTSHAVLGLGATPSCIPQNGTEGALVGFASASNSYKPSIVNLSPSAKVMPTIPSHTCTPAKNTFDKRSGRIARSSFTIPPPSPTTVISTMQNLGLQGIIHQDAFYSSESDVPEHNREWAGREFKLTSLTTPFLQEFDSSGKGETNSDGNYYIFLDKIRREEWHQNRRLTCGLRSWELAMYPPSHFEVRRWLHNHKSLTFATGVDHHASSPEGACSTKKSKLSQIDGPTQKNKHGFKYTQDQSTPRNTRREAQYMSIMSLEIHVKTRAEFVPNPEEDEIQCIFWCFETNEDQPGDTIIPGEPRFGVIVLSGSADGSMARKITWHDHTEIYEEFSELDLMIRIVEIVRGYDPDILTGFQVQGNSWGYLIERARQRYDYDLSDELSRVRAQSHKRIDKDKDKWGFNNTSTIRVTGRHVINIWRAMRSELNLLQYTMENVAFHLLHRRIPHFTWSDLTRWYANGKPQDIAKVIAYYLSRVRLDLDILEKNELIARTSEQARILGVDFFSVFSRGSQFKVESLMFRIAKLENFLLVSPSRKQIGGQNALECLPLVMEPQSAFYNGPMLVLDFQSLYPSVMIAYNYCYSTCIGRVVNWRGTNKMGFSEYHREQRLMELLKDHINIAPNGIMYTKPEIRKSLLAKMLSEILETRVMVKASMKINKADKAFQRLLNNRQLALKLIANVTYGYTSASFSGRMPCSEIADSIVQTGRETLEKAIALIHSVDRWGAEVVYGDTDSLFVYLKGRTKDQAFDIGQEIAETITNMNPRPVKLKFEKVYFPCVLVAKKRYAGFKYDSRDQEEPIFDAKGIETVRRDGTPAEQMIEEKALKILFRTSDLSQVKNYFQKQCEKIMRGSISVQDFCFAREVKLGTYSGKGPPPPGALISTKRMLLDDRAEPQYGERIRYVVVTGAPGARLVDRCVAPEELLENDNAELDAEYYILKNIIPPLERIFNLIGANVRNWYDEMPKFQRVRRVGNNFQLRHSREPHINKKVMESYMKSSSCIVCGERVGSDGPVCTVCWATKSLSLLTLQNRLGNVERGFMNLQKLCQSCSGIPPLDEVRCDSKDCPVFYTRTKQKARLNTERVILAPVLDELARNSVDPRDLEW